MYVTKVSLQNWRNFQTLDVPLRPRMFIAGPNAAGKSNLLDLFRFLRDIAKAGGGLQTAVIDRGGLSKIRCLAARRYPDVEITVEIGTEPDQPPEWRYALGIKQEVRGHRQPHLTFERVWHKQRQILDRPDADDKTDPLRLTQRSLEQINANSEFRPVAKLLSEVLYLHVVPQLVRNPEAFPGPGVPGDPFGRAFLERVAKTPQRTRRSRLKKIEAALRIAVPQLKQLTDAVDDRGIPHLEALYDHWRPRGGKQREDQFSDGTLRLIGLFWSLLESDALLLLEEPELSLNADIVRHLPGLIYRAQQQKKRQLLITTHSNDLLMDQGIAAEEVLLLTPNAEGTIVQLASAVADVRNMIESGLSVGEAVLPRTSPKRLQQLRLW